MATRVRLSTQLNIDKDIDMRKITEAGVAINDSWQQIKEMAHPTADRDAATKKYVDDLITGLDAKQSVRIAVKTETITLARQTGSGTTGSYYATLGTSAAGNTLNNAIQLRDGQRVLLLHQCETQPTEGSGYGGEGISTLYPTNGIYVVTFVGTTNEYDLVRAWDANIWDELCNAYVWVEEGDWADTAWVCKANIGGTLNTDPLVWVQFGGARTYLGRQGVKLVDNKWFELNKTDAGSGLNISAGTTANSGQVKVALKASGGILNDTDADGSLYVDDTMFVKLSKMTIETFTIDESNTVEEASAQISLGADHWEILTSSAIYTNPASNLDVHYFSVYKNGVLQRRKYPNDLAATKWDYQTITTGTFGVIAFPADYTNVGDYIEVHYYANF